MNVIICRTNTFGGFKKGARFFYKDANAPKQNRPQHIGTSVIIEMNGQMLMEHRTDSNTGAIIGDREHDVLTVINKMD